MTTDQIAQFTSTLASTKAESFTDRAIAQQALDELIKLASNLRVCLVEDDTPELRLVLACGRIKAMKRKMPTKVRMGWPSAVWVPVDGFSTITVPYNPRFADVVRRAIPNIQWEAEQKRWSFPTSQAEKIAGIAAKIFKADELRLRIARLPN